MENLKVASAVLCGTSGLILGLSVGLGLMTSADLATAQSSAAPSKFEAECPEEIKTKQSPSVPVKGWVAHVDTVNARQIFTGLLLHDGHPKENTPLFPDESKAPGGSAAAGGSSASAGAATSDVVYKMPQGRETYLACQYTNSIVRLTKKIPAGVTSCRVRFSETLGHVQKVLCD